MPSLSHGKLVLASNCQPDNVEVEPVEVVHVVATRTFSIPETCNLFVAVVVVVVRVHRTDVASIATVERNRDPAQSAPCTALATRTCGLLVAVLAVVAVGAACPHSVVALHGCMVLWNHRWSLCLLIVTELPNLPRGASCLILVIRE